MRALVLIVLFGFIFGASAGGPYFFVVTPDTVRFQHQETVVVSVFGAENVPVSVTFQYGDKVFSKQDVVIQDEANPQIIRMIVTEADIFNEDTTDKPRSIKMIAHCAFGDREADLLLSFDTGFLIVQTDKPIYSPKDVVKVRVLPLTEDLHSANTWPLTIDIKSPKDLTMGRKRSENNNDKAFFQHRFELPPRAELGIWTIKAYYGGQYDTEASLPFEVAEYVLPTYGVKVVVTPPYILPDTPSISVIVTSMHAVCFIDGMANSADPDQYADAIAPCRRYVYGKPVKGSAGLELRLKKPDGDTPFILSKLRKQLSGDDGSTEFTIEVADIRDTPNFVFPWFPDQHRLSIVADVSERATGNMEKILHESILFSTKQYAFSFERSKKFFRPGFQYYLKDIYETLRFYGGSNRCVFCDFQDGRQVDSTYPNGEKVVHVDITANMYTSGNDVPLETKSKLTDNDGQATFLFWTAEKDSLDIQVLIGNDQSETFTVQAYSSANQIRVEQFFGDDNEMIMKANNNMKLDENRYTGLLFTVWTRGILSYTKFFPSTGEVGEVVDDELQQILTPSARLIAFYVDKDTNEVVADSTKFRVTKRCRGDGISLSVKQKQVNPGEADTLTITGEPAMKVGLSIMDKALLLLNDKNVLRKQSMFKALESHDLGCGEGSGRNSVGVFQSSGVSVLTNANLAIPQRMRKGCINGRRRKRRSSDDCSRCCELGLMVAERVIDDDKDVTTLRCYSAAKVIKEDVERNASGRCIMDFYNACFEELSAYLAEKDGSRSNMEDISDYMEDVRRVGDTPTVRTDFRESWLFKEVRLDGGEAVVELMYPESITEWMIQAIGISPNKGICISEPYNVTAFKDFFIQLDIPYQAVRYEHIGIKATVFRYGSPHAPPIEVSVYIHGVDHICSNTKPGHASKRQVIVMEPNTAKTVIFPVVPLKAGKWKITVTALSSSGGNSVTDAVEKELFVVNEGIEEAVTVQICLDPLKQLEDCETNRERVVVSHNMGTQSSTVDLTLPDDAIPETGFATAYMTSSNVFENVVNTLVQGVENLFREAKYCAEQTIISVAPTVYAMHYLKQTKQVNEAIEVKGNTWIRDGLTRELTFRKLDGSYGAWLHRGSSTWLTAFVSKVFCQVRSTIDSVDVHEGNIMGSLQWLTKQQHPDGSFFDPLPVIHREMIGQLTEGDNSLTAFVLISMLECDGHSADLENSVNAAMVYLEGLNLEHLQRNPYHLAVITYALAKANSGRKHEFNKHLKLIALHDGAMTYWGNVGAGRASADAIETTAYALLAQLEFDDIRLSSEIVRWLVTQRDSAGAFRTTQDTVIGLQALSEYSIRTFSPNVNLAVKILVKKRQLQEFPITKENIHLQKIVKNLPVETGDNKFQVEVDGTGSGIMVVDLRYNRQAKPAEGCQFSISEVDVEPLDERNANVPKFLERECDVCNRCANEGDLEIEEYDMVEIANNALEPLAKFDNQEGGKFGRKKRAIRKVRATSTKTCISFTVSTIGDYVTTGMSIINFGLVTGMKAVEDDLKKLKDDGVIDMYEMPENGKAFIVFYIDKITNEPIKFTFRLVDSLNADADSRLPAAIRVYDYYNPDSQCTTFYGIGALQGPSVQYKCDGAQGNEKKVCNCVQSTCVEPWVTKLKKMKTPALYLLKRTCHNAVSDYAILVNIDVIGYNVTMGHNSATATVLQVFNKGVEKLEIDSEMTFYWKMHCNLPNLEADKKYYIIARDGIMRRDRDGDPMYSYNLMDTAVVLEKKRRCRRGCKMGMIQQVYESLIKKGCQT